MDTIVIEACAILLHFMDLYFAKVQIPTFPRLSLYMLQWGFTLIGALYINISIAND